MLIDFKDKLDDPEFTKKIPILVILVIVVFTMISFGVRMFSINSAKEQCQEAQAYVDELKAKQLQEESDDIKAVSALNKGSKVADLQTDWSRNLRKIQESKVETDKAAFETEIDKIEDELKEYFSDDSYKNCWFPGQSGLSAVWNFGTKYNVDSGVSDVPVVWICYDNSRGPVLGYTTALFHSDTELFSDVKTVVFNVSDIYRLTEHLSASVLDMLQQEPVEIAEMHLPMEYELLKDFNFDDVSGDADTTEKNTEVSENEKIDGDIPEKPTDDTEEKSDNQKEEKPKSDTKYSLDSVDDINASKEE